VLPTTTTSGNALPGYGIHHSGPPFATDNPPVSAPAPPARMTGPTTAQTAAAAGIDGTTDWHYLPLGGSCPSFGGPSSAPATTVDEHGIVAATWQNVGTDVWYYPWMCDTTVHSCSPVRTSHPWFAGWPTGNGNLWTTAPVGYLAPIDLTTSPGVNTNGHRFAIYIQSFGAGNANGGGNSPQTIITVER
jgi:hypothetical protein